MTNAFRECGIQLTNILREGFTVHDLAWLKNVTKRLKKVRAAIADFLKKYIPAADTAPSLIRYHELNFLEILELVEKGRMKTCIRVLQTL